MLIKQLPTPQCLLAKPRAGVLQRALPGLQAPGLPVQALGGFGV